MEAMLFLMEILTNRISIYNLRIEDPFVKEIIEIWSETFFEGKIVSKDHFSSVSTSLAKFINKNK